MSDQKQNAEPTASYQMVLLSQRRELPSMTEIRLVRLSQLFLKLHHQTQEEIRSVVYQ